MAIYYGVFMKERYDLSKERILEIVNETEGLGKYGPFFLNCAEYINGLLDIYEDVQNNGPVGNHSIEELRDRNLFLYEDVSVDNYKNSYVNPEFAAKEFGESGKYLCVLLAEIRGMIPFIFEGSLDEIVIRLEFFLEIYGMVKCAIESGEEVSIQDLHDSFYYYVFDYTEDESVRKIGEQLKYTEDYATRIIRNSDWNDIRNLYAFGEYVSKTEEETFEAISKLDEETVKLMSFTYTDGFKRGFDVSGKDMSKKKTVNIRYRLGFERVVLKAIEEFENMGLKPVIYRAGYDIFTRFGIFKPGYYGGLINPQFDEDHKEDMSLVLDGQLVTRRIEGMTAAYEQFSKEASEWAGPACMEIFGEDSFVPADAPNALRYGKDKQALIQDYRIKASEIMNKYIKREERSFTIIAWPTPAIGDRFEEILKDIITINTLPVDEYEKIQTTIINTLDEGDYAYVKGMNGNKTELKVALYKIANPDNETSFENCLADVNIPLGEVFTSPQMKGTEGVLHVKEVFLNDLKFIDIMLTIKDGKISDYSCGNFSEESKNKAFIEENLLFHHKTLPMGEFAIGTNTFAYASAKKFDIFNKMPILIAEKMGPHFAFGDTCYSNEESVRVFNPDGKEMMAKANGEEYTYCHTDVTIPYDELGELGVVTYDGRTVKIISEGRFVLEGTEKLNEAF